jgi:hypothetical protein
MQKVSTHLKRMLGLGVVMLKKDANFFGKVKE